jgi:hypothetical protein
MEFPLEIFLYSLAAIVGILIIRLGVYHRCDFVTIAMFPGGNFAERCHRCKVMKLWSTSADGQVRVRLIKSAAEQEKLLSVKVSPKDLRGVDLTAGDEPQARGERGGDSWWPTRSR